MTCAKMAKFCNEPDYKVELQIACPATCCLFSFGNAPVGTPARSLPATVAQPPVESSEIPAEQTLPDSTSNCEDSKDVPCVLLAHECNSSEFGTQLQHDCPKSCGVCVGAKIPTVSTKTPAVNTKTANVKTNPGSASVLCEDNLLLPCATLVDKCYSPIGGARVRVVCPVSCGVCNPVTDIQSAGFNVAASNGTSCVDKPGLNVDGIMVACPQLVNECKIPPLAAKIQAACPKTCGLCSGVGGSTEIASGPFANLEHQNMHNWKKQGFLLNTKVG